MGEAGGIINAQTGRAVATTLLNSSSWILRKVDSLRLMEGTVGRRRISLDIVPPVLTDLAYHENERQSPGIEGIRGPVMVPLTMMKKGALRDFDIILGDGRPLSVLGRSENSALAAAAVLAEISSDAFENEWLVSAVLEIASGPADEALELFREFELTGNVRGQNLLDPHAMSEFGTQLLRDLAQNYLLVALVPSELAGLRTLVKYSFHWDVTDWSDQVGPTKFLFASGGYIPASVIVDLSGPSDPDSYHLEVHAPKDLLCGRLALPAGVGEIESGCQTMTPIAHAVASFSEPPAEPAQVEFFVPNGGLRAVAAVVAIVSAVVFWLERLLPGGHEALLDAPEGAVALLLAVPAVATALLARPNENDLTARLLIPLRALVLTCSAFLAAGAASLVGYLHEPYMSALWWLGAGFTAAVSLYMLGGYGVSARRQAGWRRETHR